jgi:hypothetical protein
MIIYYYNEYTRDTHVVDSIDELTGLDDYNNIKIIHLDNYWRSGKN